MDLTETLYIDEEGKRVLKKLFGDGAFFRSAGPMTESIVGEITGKSPNPWRGVLLQSMLVLLAAGILRGAADPPAAPATLKLTLRDAVQLALKQNPQVQIANLNIAESQEHQTVARFELLPQIRLGVSDTLRRANLETAFGKRIPGFPGPIGPLYVIQAGPSFPRRSSILQPGGVGKYPKRMSRERERKIRQFGRRRCSW